MKDSKALVLAAQRVFSGADCCGCGALASVLGFEAGDAVARRYLWPLYYGDLDIKGDYHRSDPNGQSSPGVFFWGAEEKCEARIIGLCLAAAIAKCEGC